MKKKTTGFLNHERRLLARRLKRVRVRKLLMPDEMAALLGITEPTYRGLENNDSRFTIGTMRKIRAFDAKLLRGIVDPDVLIPARNQMRDPA